MKQHRWISVLAGILVMMLGLAGCGASQPSTPTPISSNTEQVTKASDFQSARLEIVTSTISVPKEAPPILEKHSDWSELTTSSEQQIDLEGRRLVSSDDEGYDYVLKNDLPDEQQTQHRDGANYYANKLYRLNRTNNKAPEVILRPINTGWSITEVAMGVDVLWWCEVNQWSRPATWQFYEKTKDGSPHLLGENKSTDASLGDRPAVFASDGHRLVYEQFDPANNQLQILYRDAKTQKQKVLATLDRVDKNGKTNSFYPPKISGQWVTWSEIQYGEGEESVVMLYDLEKQSLTALDSGERCLTEPVISGKHLVVRMKPEGQNFVEHQEKDGTITYEGAELWHYDLEKKSWGFRLTNESTLYKNLDFKPATLSNAEVNGDYLIWRTEPATSAPMIVDMNKKQVYILPAAQAKKNINWRIGLTNKSFYWGDASDTTLHINRLR